MLEERAGEDASLLPLSVPCIKEGVLGEGRVSLSSQVSSLESMAGESSRRDAVRCVSTAREWGGVLLLFLGRVYGRTAEIISEAAGCRRLIPRLVHAWDGPESLPPLCSWIGGRTVVTSCSGSEQQSRARDLSLHYSLQQATAPTSSIFAPCRWCCTFPWC